MKKNLDFVSKLQNDPFSALKGKGVIMSEIIEEEVDFKPEDFLPPEIQNTGFPSTSHNIFLGKERVEQSKDQQNKNKNLELNEEKMSEIERQKFEKIRWQIPDVKSEGDEEEKKSTRFDFDGNIISLEDEKTRKFSNEFYHHGKEPSRPGYNLEEILMLIRSENMAQKVLFLDVFSKVLKVQQKENYRFYDVHIVPLFEKLKLFDLLQVIGKKNKKNDRISSILNNIYHTLFQADQFLHFSRLHLRYSETKSVPFISPLPQDPALQRWVVKTILPEILNNLEPSSMTLLSSLHPFLRIKDYEILLKKSPEECINALYLHFTQNNGYSSLPQSFHEKVAKYIKKVIDELKPVPDHCSTFFHGIVKYYTTDDGEKKSLDTSHKGLLKFSVSKVHEYVEKFPHSTLGFINSYLPGRNDVIFDILSKFIQQQQQELSNVNLGIVCELLFPIVLSKEYVKNAASSKLEHPVRKLLDILRPIIIDIFHKKKKKKKEEKEKQEEEEREDIRRRRRIMSSWKNWLRRTFSIERMKWWKYNSNKGSPSMILCQLENEEIGIKEKIEELYSDIFILHQILKFCWMDKLYISNNNNKKKKSSTTSSTSMPLPHEEMIWEACLSLILVGDLGRSSVISELYINRYRKFVILPFTDCLRFLIKSSRLFRKKKRTGGREESTARIPWNEKIERIMEFYLLYMSTQPRDEKRKDDRNLKLIDEETEGEEEEEEEEEDDDDENSKDLISTCFLNCVKNTEARRRLREVLLSRNSGILQGDWFLFVIEEYYRNLNDEGGAARIWSPSLIHPTLMCLNDLENSFFTSINESSSSSSGGENNIILFNNYVDQVIPFHVRFVSLLKLLPERNGLKMYENPSIREEMEKYLEHYFSNYFSHPVPIFHHNNIKEESEEGGVVKQKTKLRNEDEESMFLEFVNMILREYMSVSFRDNLFSTFLLILLGRQWSIRTRTKILNDLKRCLFLYFQKIEKKYQNLYFQKNATIVLPDSTDHFELAKIIVEDYFDSEESCLECKKDNLFMYNVLLEMLKDFFKCSKNYRYFIVKKLNPLLKKELEDVL